MAGIPAHLHRASQASLSQDAGIHRRATWIGALRDGRRAGEGDAVRALAADNSGSLTDWTYSRMAEFVVLDLSHDRDIGRASDRRCPRAWIVSLRPTSTVREP